MMFHPFRPLVYTAEAILEFGEPTRLSSDRSSHSNNPISVNALHAGYEPGSYLRGEHRCRAMLDRGVMVEDPRAFVRYRIDRAQLPDLEGVVGILDLDSATMHMHEGVMASAVAARSADIERAGAFLEPIVVAISGGAGEVSPRSVTPMRTVVYGDEAHTVEAIPPDRFPAGFDRFGDGLVVIDGHHRIAAAQNHAKINGVRPSVLAMVVDIESSGLFVVPQHRVLGGATVQMDRLDDDVTVTPYRRGQLVPPGSVAVVSKETSVLISTPRPHKPGAEARISSVTLSRTLIDPLGLWVEGFATRESDAYAELDSGACAVAIMGDLDISDIVATASKGLVLPEKTTCFSPKVAVGLVGVAT